MAKRTKKEGLPIAVFGPSPRTKRGAEAMDEAMAAEERRYWRQMDKGYARSAEAKDAVAQAQAAVSGRLEGESARATYLGQEMTKGGGGPEPRVRRGGKSGAKALLAKLKGTRVGTIDQVLVSFGDEGGTAEEISQALQKNWRKHAMAQLPKKASEEAKKAALEAIERDIAKLTPDRVGRMLENRQFANVVASKMVKGTTRYGAAPLLVENQKKFAKAAQTASRYVTGRSLGGVASEGLKAGAMRVGLGVAGRVFLPLWIGAMLWDATVGRSNQDELESAEDLVRGESVGELILGQGRAARGEGAIRGAEGRLAVDQLIGGRFRELADASPPPENDPDELFAMMMGGT